MKLFGSKRKAKHVSKGKSQQDYYDVQQSSKHTQKQNEEELQPKKSKKKNTGLKVTFVVLLVILILLVAVFAWYKTSVKPPKVTENKSTSTSAPVQSDNSSGNSAITATRSGDDYTFVLLGTDDGNGNTDTIMVGNFNTENYTLDILSIPRDTLVNVSWSVKKANTLWAYGGTDGVKEGLSDILGYNVDFYVVVDLEAFQVLVDAIGGVYYDVPVSMDYDDPYQDLYIHLDAGPQQLTGSQAIGVVRYRSGYANADIGRIGTQQDFLMTVANQVLANKSSLKIKDLANVFLNYVDTDLSYGNLVWLAQEFFKVSSDSINFYTLPGNYGDYVYQGTQNVSYVTIYVNQWLEMLNEHFNPFDEDITAEQLSILTRGSDGYLYSTNGVYAYSGSWGGSNASGAEANSSPAPEKSTAIISSGGSTGTTGGGGSTTTTDEPSTPANPDDPSTPTDPDDPSIPTDPDNPDDGNDANEGDNPGNVDNPDDGNTDDDPDTTTPTEPETPTEPSNPSTPDNNTTETENLISGSQVDEE